jgi:16S rRNA (cytosine1407-C5)-methyltransferase
LKFRRILTVSFDEFYRKIYGSRWDSLRESLLLPARTVPYSQGLAVPYFLDRASVLAALSLRLPDDAPANAVPPEKPPLILDACAAPGGKAMVIASTMGGNTELLANDLSSERRRRLEAALDKHLPPETRARVKVSGFDAAAAAGRKSEQGRFVAVLLDAPCSSERHVIQDAAALEQWTLARPRSLARRQWALLSAAFLLLAPGGSLVYATCSINPEENDGVASKLIKKYANCILDKPDFSEGEDCICGKLILPDTSAGLGPLYTARFGKSLDPELV